MSLACPINADPRSQWKLGCQLAHGLLFWYTALIHQIITLPTSGSLLHFAGRVPTSGKYHMDDFLLLHIFWNFSKPQSKVKRFYSECQYTQHLGPCINCTCFRTISMVLRTDLSFEGEFVCCLWLCVLPGYFQNPFQQYLAPQAWHTEQCWTVKHFYCPWYCQMNSSKKNALFAMHQQSMRVLY